MLILLETVHGREREQEAPSNVPSEYLSRKIPDPSCTKSESEAQDQRTVAEKSAEEPPVHFPKPDPMGENKKDIAQSGNPNSEHG